MSKQLYIDPSAVRAPIEQSEGMPCSATSLVFWKSVSGAPTASTICAER